MASVTLAKAARLSLLTGGVLESMGTTYSADFLQLLPFESIDGGALTYDRKTSSGTVTPVKSTLVKIVGHTEVC